MSWSSVEDSNLKTFYENKLNKALGSFLVIKADVDTSLYPTQIDLKKKLRVYFEKYEDLITRNGKYDNKLFVSYG